MQQGSLFDLLPPEDSKSSVGLAGVVPSIKAEMNRVTSEYVPGRGALTDKMTAIARREAVALSSGGGKSISPTVLDKLLQPSEQGHAPSINAIMCFCLATGDARPIKPILKALGLTVIDKRDLEYLEYGKICMAERELRERKKALLRFKS